ncbi:tripartite tricarboxylate transporter substrate binding protein [Xenophilus arseniciresistens]|uniref:Tripartite tricarboxylate transporter substrate binding protein n=1 Tax=Xenophilus arseniciresistens TaxID=1283306 RepID=A0AAE3NG16_9BURK|nr:tripartite tricarboxylate transporter substrate binding protein [Xenophilus arseniciresistens]MDA7418994.1 tripartite tricarboxylate transporter substrate binding protein [Xenophilus arseniciresistens]
MMFRRQWLALSALALCALVPCAAQADTFPSRPIKIVVPFAAGGTGDVLIRSLQEPMQRHLGQPIVVENRLGASGSMGTVFVRNAPADGYTLLQVGNSTVTTPMLQKSANYDSQKDLAAVGLIATTPMVFLVNPVVPATDLRQLIDHARANPGKLEFSSAGRGSLAHLATESFNQAAGLKMVFVPYQGAAQAVNAVLAGEVKVALTTPSDAINAFVSAGRLRMLAVSSEKRSPLLPDVPAISETLPNFSINAFFGISAPAGTPAPVVARLNDALNKSLAEPAMQAKLKALGMFPRPANADSFAQMMKRDHALWTSVITKAGIEAE